MAEGVSHRQEAIHLRTGPTSENTPPYSAHGRTLRWQLADVLVAAFDIVDPQSKESSPTLCRNAIDEASASVHHSMIVKEQQIPLLQAKLNSDSWIPQGSIQRVQSGDCALVERTAPDCRCALDPIAAISHAHATGPRSEHGV